MRKDGCVSTVIGRFVRLPMQQLGGRDSRPVPGVGSGCCGDEIPVEHLGQAGLEAHLVDE